MDKASLRNQAKARRLSLSDEYVSHASEKICSFIMNMREYDEADCILAYIAVNNEVSLRPVIRDALISGRKLYIPRVDGDSMVFIRYDGNEVALKRSSFGIPEPEYDEERLWTPSLGKTLIIMPGVAFDRYKCRIGYGGGYYDRFLRSVHPDADDRGRIGIGSGLFSIGVCFDCQLVPEIPVEKHDICPERLVTETEVIS